MKLIFRGYISNTVSLDPPQKNMRSGKRLSRKIVERSPKAYAFGHHFVGVIGRSKNLPLLPEGKTFT